MLLTTAEDLSSFITELQSETDRGLPLVAAALVDELLMETLRSFFIEGASSKKMLNGGVAPIGTMSARLELCHSLGLIDKFEYDEIQVLRKIRNKFAHSRHGLDFSNDQINGLCQNFKSPLPEGGGYPTDAAKFRLINATVAVVLRLYHRPDWVALERRKPKIWVDPDLTRWRSIGEELPPEGEVVLGLHPQQIGLMKYNTKPQE